MADSDKERLQRELRERIEKRERAERDRIIKEDKKRGEVSNEEITMYEKPPRPKQGD